MFLSSQPLTAVCPWLFVLTVSLNNKNRRVHNVTGKETDVGTIDDLEFVFETLRKAHEQKLVKRVDFFVAVSDPQDATVLLIVKMLEDRGYKVSTAPDKTFTKITVDFQVAQT
jgi:hypothetical protein